MNARISAFAVLVLALTAALWAMTRVDDRWKEQLMLFSWVLLIAIVAGELLAARLDRKRR